ncbi:MAG: Uncharacterized protein XD64_0476 [Thermotoga sp. 47_83]|jgi:hypothetical protein|uniref:Uncharacterized protein n=1 Tax=Thermotoga petrophila TaxID=93929 RepID=A0A101ERP1_9THEM|nr:MAG: Uncharacterized protein XD57_0234 [Thermotoga petrophila]KUK33692.1 MAG: Uncharacterized protein XD64_0476 [Thermotoga sp. 47_83]MBZ4660958.1 hypothetical protein [Thermotoga sp.]MDK2893584.1 hypothetical protein [Thermotoga sp.]MDK2898322.1 hypothetical protein [Thermotoga sp.]
MGSFVLFEQGILSDMIMCTTIKSRPLEGPGVFV